MGKKPLEADHASNSAVDEDATGDGLKAPVPDEGLRKNKKYKQNWRLNMLSIPRVLTQKYVTPEYTLNTGVDSEALNAECTDRTEQLALSGMRYLRVNKSMYTPLRGPEYGKLMDNYIEKSWNSIYNYYRKSMHDLKKRKAEQRKKPRLWRAPSSEKRGKKGKHQKVDKKESKSSQKSKEAMEKEHAEWCDASSKPKVIAIPQPVDRGPICDLAAFKPRQDEISTPKRIYKSPSKDSNFKDPTKVNPAALTYAATERIIFIAQPPPHRLLKAEEIIPGSVKPSALTYKISDRVTQLAIPKPTTIARESDLNEDAFTISPAALKYVASPRILEIAKPKEY